MNILCLGDYIVNGTNLVLVEGVTLGTGYFDTKTSLYYGVKDGKVVSVSRDISSARYPDEIEELIRQIEEE